MQLGVPVPPEAPDVRVHPPVVHVAPVWEYKCLLRRAAESLPGEAELNGLGKVGWELTGVVAHAGATHFYFKRLSQ
ncbi:MAG: hypothetical protein GTO22_03685 [Gemmatimonadales bacterium]|nr:hypothetical protein [Gemmatimonadales bacterium]